MAFGEVDEFNGLAEPAGHPVVEHEHWFEELLEFGEADKIELALDLERRVRAGDPRIKGVRTPRTPMVRGRLPLRRRPASSRRVVGRRVPSQ